MTIGTGPSKVGGACVPLSGMGVLAAANGEPRFLKPTHVRLTSYRSVREAAARCDHSDHVHWRRKYRTAKLNKAYEMIPTPLARCPVARQLSVA